MVQLKSPTLKKYDHWRCHAGFKKSVSPFQKKISSQVAKPNLAAWIAHTSAAFLILSLLTSLLFHFFQYSFFHFFPFLTPVSFVAASSLYAHSFLLFLLISLTTYFVHLCLFHACLSSQLLPFSNFFWFASLLHQCSYFLLSLLL